MSLDLNADLTMKVLLEQYPGARRALFSAFHIGGCQSCAYDPEDSLATVCSKNEIPIEEALTCLKESHAHDQEMMIQPDELKALLTKDTDFTLLDTRTREEFEAITLPGAQLMTQDLQTQLFADSDHRRKIILIDHQGRSVLDHCAWFRGHGLKNTFGVDGGIDRYAKEIDSSIPRYRLEMD
ncbi:MAG: rhodanese-like domain-containing protein [Akkermansiaceae bacterium]